jgi:hypothetical protein
MIEMGSSITLAQLLIAFDFWVPVKDANDHLARKDSGGHSLAKLVSISIGMSLPQVTKN